MRIKSVIISLITLLIVCTVNAQPKKEDFLVKTRGGFFKTNETVSAGSGGTTTTPKFNNGYGAELALTYLFTENVAAEIAGGYLATEFTSTGINKIVNAIPITATAQFYLPIYDKMIPYVGAGYSHSFFFNEPANVKISSAGAIVIQCGIDLYFLETLFHSPSFHNVGINVDLKYRLSPHHNVTIGGEIFRNELSSLTIMGGVAVPF
jgi:outer membrane protein W